MPDSAVPVSGGSGYNVDTFTQSNGDHRQAVVVGDASGAQTVVVDSTGRAAVAASGLSVTTPSIVSMTSGTAYTVSVSAGGNVTFWIQGSNSSATASVTIGTIVFEQSDDGFAWAPLSVVRSDNSLVVQSVSGGTIAAGAALALDAALEGINFVRARATSNPSVGTQYLHALVGGMPFSPAVSVTAGSLTANPPGVTKGTQGTTGYMVQNLRDAGRTPFTLSGTALTVGTASTETLLSLTPSRSWATGGTAAASHTVTSGKILRITHIAISFRLGGTNAGWTRFALRAAPASGTVSTSSAIVWQMDLSSNTGATAIISDRFGADFPDGIEIPSTGAIGVSVNASVTSIAHNVSVIGFEY